MTRNQSSHGAGFRIALFCALCFAACVTAGEPNDVFWIDGMAVDAMTTEPDAVSPFRRRMPSLAEGGPRMPRGRLLDEPESPRDPLIHRQISELAQEADRLARAGNVPAALLTLRDALALDPRNPALLSRAAIHASTERDFERAAGFFRRFIEIEPDDAAHLGGYAAVLLRLARLDETERYLRRAELIQPDGLVVRFTRLVLDLLHERETADPAYWTRRPVEQVTLIAGWLQTDRETLTRLIGAADFVRVCALALGEGTQEHLPEINDALRGVRAARQEGNVDAGVREIERLRALGVSGLGLEAERAEILFEAGRQSEAVDLWRALVDLDAGWREAWFNLGFALFRTDAYAEAADALRRSRSDREPPVVRFLLASALSLAGEDDEPRDLYVELARTHPDEFRQWMEADARFRRAVRRMDIYRNLLRRVGIPPELE